MANIPAIFIASLYGPAFTENIQVKKGRPRFAVYLIWKTYVLSGKETGQLFGITCSAVSHILSSMRTRMQKEPVLRVKHKHIFTMQDVTPKPRAASICSQRSLPR